jgi:hypothetical protein
MHKRAKMHNARARKFRPVVQPSIPAELSGSRGPTSTRPQVRTFWLWYKRAKMRNKTDFLLILSSTLLFLTIIAGVSSWFAVSKTISTTIGFSAIVLFFVVLVFSAFVIFYESEEKSTGKKIRDIFMDIATMNFCIAFLNFCIAFLGFVSVIFYSEQFSIREHYLRLVFYDPWVMLIGINVFLTALSGILWVIMSIWTE